MRVLFDANVYLDALLARKQGPEAMFLLDRARSRTEIGGLVTPTILTTVFYVGGRHLSRDSARSFVQEVLAFVEVIPVTEQHLQRAVRRHDDFEDGVISETATDAGVDVICTRNVADFASSSVQICTPRELAPRLG